MSGRGRPPFPRPLVLISGLGAGGAEAVTAAFLCRLARERISVPVCTVTARHDGRPARELADAGVERLDLGARRLADPAALFRLRRLLAVRGIDVLHAHGQDATILGALGTVGRQCAFVATRHVLAEPEGSWRERLRARMASRAFGRADLVVAVSRAVADRLARSGSVPRERIRVMPNGVELERFDDAAAGGSESARASARRELGLGSDEAVVLVPAVFRPGKGHELLLEAVPALRRRVPGVRILLAGGGGRAATLEARARRMELGDAVRFLGHREDVPRLLRACDVVALPSRAEALPTALIEAAAAGRPAVATRVGGTPEVVEHGETGLLVEPGDAGALASALAGLLEDADRARRYGRAARRRAEQRFDIDRQVERTLELWREVAPSGAATRDGGGRGSA